MKTIKSLMMAMSAVAMMMTASVNTASASNSKWKMISTDASATEAVDRAPLSGKVLQYIYMNDDDESRRFIYSVDADGRVTNRVMYGWDNVHQSWVPMSMMHADYGAKIHTLTHLCWNAEKKRFVANQASQTFNASNYTGSIIHLPVSDKK